MSTLRAAIIGAGRPRRTEGCTGFGMGHFHADGFKAAEDCDLIAVADIKPENAQAFADEHAGVKPYFDYKEMLQAEKPGEDTTRNFLLLRRIHLFCAGRWEELHRMAGHTKRVITGPVGVRVFDPEKKVISGPKMGPDPKWVGPVIYSPGHTVRKNKAGFAAFLDDEERVKDCFG